MEGACLGDAADDEGMLRKSTGAIPDQEQDADSRLEREGERGLLGRYRCQSVRLLPTYYARDCMVASCGVCYFKGYGENFLALKLQWNGCVNHSKFCL